MIELQNPYISVEYETDRSYGGNQRMSGNRVIASCGCGLVAALDVLLYLAKNKACSVSADIKSLSLYDFAPAEKYNAVLKKLAISYLPVIPGHGMNGLGLMAGMQMYFKRYSLPYTCYWCISDKGIWDKVEMMLKRDIPVIMSIGPNFPRVWKDKKLFLYKKLSNGEFRHTSSVKAHFITITGMDDNWLKISSWGQCYYINRRMYEEYVSIYSAALVSNILYIKEK